MAKKLISFIFSLFLLFDIVCADEINVKSEKYILYNMNDNSMLLNKGEHDEVSIASLTKIVTVITAIENAEKQNNKIIISEEMLDDIPWDFTKVGFEVGDVVTFDDLLYGTMIKSGADAANALGIYTSGDLDSFINLMNEIVNKLGLKNSHFTNTMGDYGINHYSSAYDMAEILKYALKNDKFKEVFTTRTYTLSTGKKLTSTLVGYNKTLGADISFITGSKTGFIDQAGYCLASTATIDNVDYLLVTLNAFNDSSAHVKDSVTIYKHFGDNYGYKNIVKDNDVVVTLKTKYASEKQVDIIAGYSKDKYLKNDFDKSKIEYEYEGINEVSYFIDKGTVLGTVKVKYNDEVLDSFDLIYNQELSFSIFAFLCVYKYYLIGFIFALIIILKLKNKNKKRSKKEI